MTATATYCHRDGAILIADGTSAISVPLAEAPGIARYLASTATRGREEGKIYFATLSNAVGTVVIHDNELLPLASAIDHAVATPRIAAELGSAPCR